MVTDLQPATFAERHPLKGSRFWSRTAPDGPWDTIVVGSGIGGLTTAAILSDLGHRVLVLEQHYVPGGFTHAFSHKGWVWDVGVHAIGEVTSHTASGRLLAHLTRDRLAWESLGPVYEEFHFPEGLRVDFPDDPKQFRANLVSAFPNQAPAIDRYLQIVRTAARAMQRHYAARSAPRWLAPIAEAVATRRAKPWLRTVEDVLTELTDDAKLRAVLAAQWGYYGTPPSQAAFGIQALVTKHYLHGAYYPVGGAQEIARTLCQTISESGGWTRVVADVDEILVERGRTVGVRLSDGEEIRSRRVVLASGIGASVDRLLPESLRRLRWAESVRQVGAGPAHLCLYLGFRGDPRAAGASGANQWFYNSWDWDQAMWRIDPNRELTAAPVLYTSFPSLKDAAHDAGPDQLHTGEVVTFVPWEAFSRWSETRWNRRGQEYEAFKADLTEQILRQLFVEMPGLEPLLDYAELSTPVSTDFFCRPLRGSIYGLEATPDRFLNRDLRARSPVRNLFFSGGDIASGGVMGAFGGGMLAALAMEPWAAGRRLESL